MGTVSELLEHRDKIEMLAYGNDLEVITHLMHYLDERKRAAKLYMSKGDEQTYELLRHINKEIAKILSLF